MALANKEAMAGHERGSLVLWKRRAGGGGVDVRAGGQHLRWGAAGRLERTASEGRVQDAGLPVWRDDRPGRLPQVVEVRLEPPLNLGAVRVRVGRERERAGGRAGGRAVAQEPAVRCLCRVEPVVQHEVGRRVGPSAGEGGTGGQGMEGRAEGEALERTHWGDEATPSITTRPILRGGSWLTR